MKQKAYGFTIVELLIVIVVIGILAAISIVAYNGMSAKAKYAQQVADLDRIGKAIQLWSAENGKTLGQSGAGYQGLGLGGFTSTSSSNASYTSVSVENLLRDSGYLTGSFSSFSISTVMVAPCTNTSSTRWVVLAMVSPAPEKSAAEQLADTGCTYGTIATYTGGGYNRNLLKAY